MAYWHYVVFFSLFVSSWSWGQPIVIEDFEGDLSNWTIIEGQMEISDRQVFEGQGALRMHLPNIDWANHILEHNSFFENFGRYTYHFFTDGEASDADLYIMYLDDTHYYKVSCKPAGTDNPELVLCKGTPNGEVVIERLDPNFDQSRWFKVTLERYCDGHTHVFIDDEQLISLDDYAHFGKGRLRLRGWAENTYIDQVTFEPFPPELFVERMDLCVGDSVWLGGAYRNSAGVYLDTFSDPGATCLQIREVTLELIDPEAVEIDHILLCPYDSIQLGGEWIDSPGSYTIEDRSSGCLQQRQVQVELFPEQELTEQLDFCSEEGPLSYQGEFSHYAFQGGDTMTSLVFSEPGNYVFWGIDENQCKQRIELQLEESCQSFYIPNAFTPNGDQINDTFFAAPVEPSDQVKITIYNRWGGIGYQSHSNEWDGRIDGKPGQPGTYLYLLEINGRQFSGEVALLR